MEPIGTNPLGLLTFLVAPAILTNASSIMVLSTSNRFGLAIDRVKQVASDLELRIKESRPGVGERAGHLKQAQQRVLMLVRAMTTFYVSVGSFVSASLLALSGALLDVVRLDLLRYLSLCLSLTAGVTGVAGLMTGCALLIRESRLALTLLTSETSFQEQFAVSGPSSNHETPSSPN